MLPTLQEKPKALVYADSFRQVKLEHRDLTFTNPREPSAAVPRSRGGADSPLQGWGEGLPETSTSTGAAINIYLST